MSNQNQLPNDLEPINQIPNDLVPVNTSSANPAFLPNENAVMDSIKNRPSMIQSLIQDPSTLDRFIKHPLGTTLRTIGGGMEYLEGAPATIGLDLQNGNPSSIPQHIQQLLQGQRPAQLGDLIRTTGFGGSMNGPIAAGSGMIASLGLMPGGSAATEAAPKLIANAAKPVTDTLLGLDIQSKYVPQAEKLYQEAVTKFTPQIQDLAANKLHIPSDVIDHIATRTPTQVTASSQAMNNNPGAIAQLLQNGLAQKESEFGKAYDAAWNSVPKNTYIALPKTFDATKGFLQNNKIIDNVGNLTDYGKQAIGDDSSLNKVYGNYLLMKSDSGAATTAAQRANIAPVNQAQWTVMRNNFSKARNSTNYQSPITSILDALHSDAVDAGIPIQGARDLARANFQMQDVAKPFLTDTAENKLANVFNLTDKQINNLQSIEQYTGQNLIQRAKDIAANNQLQKIMIVGKSSVGQPSLINSLIEKRAAINPLEIAKSYRADRDLHDLIGNGNQLNSLLSSINKNSAIRYGSLGATEELLRRNFSKKE